MRGSEFAELRAFTAVAERLSFVRAAEHLGIAPSTLSQTVRALEARLGIALLTRTTRKVSLTSAGIRLLERFAPALDEMNAAILEAYEVRALPRGIVRLHVPRPAYRTHVEPILGRVREALPDVTLDLSIDDAPADSLARGFDLVVRREEFVEGDLTAVDLGPNLRHAAVASKAYLAARGTPATPASLSDHRCIRWRPAGLEIQLWRFEEAGTPLTVAVDGPLIVTHCEAAVAAALEDVGIAYVLEAYSAPYVTDARLVPILTEYLPSLGGWKLCHPRQGRLTAAGRAVVGILAGQP